MKPLAITCVLFLSIGKISSQSILSLQPDSASGKDASLGYHDFYGTDQVNYGDNIYFFAFCKPGFSGGMNANRAVINFALTGIPKNATILTATLNLFATGYVNSSLPGHYGNNQAVLQRITSPWEESTITWAIAASTTTQNEVIIPTSESAKQDYNMDVTTLVKFMVENPDSAFGFYFRLVTENPQDSAALTFFSSDCQDSSKRPMLFIDYSVSASRNLLKSNEICSLILYPNPSHGNVTVHADNDGFKPIKISVYNSTGQLVSVENIVSIYTDNIQFSTQGLKNGLYFVQFLSNKFTFTKNFMVKNL